MLRCKFYLYLLVCILALMKLWRLIVEEVVINLENILWFWSSIYLRRIFLFKEEYVLRFRPRTIEELCLSLGGELLIAESFFASFLLSSSITRFLMRLIGLDGACLADRELWVLTLLRAQMIFIRWRLWAYVRYIICRRSLLLRRFQMFECIWNYNWKEIDRKEWLYGGIKVGKDFRPFWRVFEADRRYKCSCFFNDFHINNG